MWHMLLFYQDKNPTNTCMISAILFYYKFNM